MITLSVNWLAIIVCTILNMIVGGLWYGPLFGKQWMKELGFTMEYVQEKQSWKDYLVAIFNSFTMAFIMANVISWTDISGVVNGLLLGLIMWFGFTGFTFAATHAFEGRSLRLWRINSGIYLVNLLITGAILAIW